MSSVSLSRPSNTDAATREPGLWLWPRSLFGRLFGSVLIALLLAQALMFVLVARDRDRLVVQGNVRESSRRIVDLTFALQLLAPAERPRASARLEGWPPPASRRAGRARPLFVGRAGPVPDFAQELQRQLATTLGPAYTVQVLPASGSPTGDVIRVVRPPPEGYESGGHQYDVRIGLPDATALTYRVSQGRRGPPLPRNLMEDLIVLTITTAVVLFVAARSITRPLSRLARAAEGIGRNVRGAPVPERGSEELREAARAFNTMQERMQRYIDSRTRVLAAMSHDLKTPLTRLRLRVETLGDDDVRARFGRDLDEMESMVHGALALLKGLTDDEPTSPVDIDALLEQLRAEFAELGAEIVIAGHAQQRLRGRPQALKRCLTNLLSNAVKFGVRATVRVEDGPALVLRVQDQGPGLPDSELERVFEPFYRVESSRNRDTGGTGLGLCIARDVAQAHGGSLMLRNRREGGLEAVLTLPRARKA